MAHNHFANTDIDPNCDLCQLAQAYRPLVAPARYEPQAYDEVRVGNLTHLSFDAPAAPGARTFCGIWLAGTPVAPTSLGECEACEALRPCDECGHTGPDHLWAPALEATGQAAASRYVYDHATCWAENICRGCNPELHAAALELTSDSPAGAGHLVEADRG